MEHIHELALRCMLFRDDKFLLRESNENLNERLEPWIWVLETYGFDKFELKVDKDELCGVHFTVTKYSLIEMDVTIARLIEGILMTCNGLMKCNVKLMLTNIYVMYRILMLIYVFFLQLSVFVIGLWFMLIKSIPEMHLCKILKITVITNMHLRINPNTEMYLQIFFRKNGIT